MNASQTERAKPRFLTPPIGTHIYTADPSAHVFTASCTSTLSDIDAGVPPDDLGSHFAMRDYHVLSMERIGGLLTDHGVLFTLDDVPWPGRQMWPIDAYVKQVQ